MQGNRETGRKLRLRSYRLSARADALYPNNYSESSIHCLPDTTSNFLELKATGNGPCIIRFTEAITRTSVLFFFNCFLGNTSLLSA